MSPKMISFLILIWMSFQVRCSAPDYCDAIITNGTFSGLKIYRHFEGEDYQNHTIRVYNEHNEFEVEFRDMSLKFIRTLPQTRPVRYKFSFYYNKLELQYNEKGKGVANCEVYPSEKEVSTEWKTNCTSPTARFPDFKIMLPFKYPNEAVFVSLISGDGNSVEQLMAFDRNDRRKWYTFVLGIPIYIPCGTSTNRCQIPTFIKELDDSYFTLMEGVLIGHQIADKPRNNLILFNIDGRPKYCITSDTNLSEECNSSEKMKTLFKECFTTPTQTTKPIRDPTKPIGDPSKPIGHQTKPIGDQTKPIGDQTKPIGDQTKPIGDQTKPLETTESIENSTKLLETPKPTEDSIDPKLIVFIVQIIVTIILMAGVGWFAYYKYGPMGKTQDSAEKTKSESESSELERERRNNETLIKSAETVASEVSQT